MTHDDNTKRIVTHCYLAESDGRGSLHVDNGGGKFSILCPDGINLCVRGQQLEVYVDLELMSVNDTDFIHKIGKITFIRDLVTGQQLFPVEHIQDTKGDTNEKNQDGI